MDGLLAHQRHDLADESLGEVAQQIVLQRVHRVTLARTRRRESNDVRVDGDHAAVLRTKTDTQAAHTLGEKERRHHPEKGLVGVLGLVRQVRGDFFDRGMVLVHVVNLEISMNFLFNDLVLNTFQ